MRGAVKLYKKRRTEEKTVAIDWNITKFRAKLLVPDWFWSRSNSVCQIENCHRFIDLTCRTCKFQGKMPVRILKNPFLFVIWCLQKQLGMHRDIVREICKRYLTLPCNFEFSCPYVWIGSGLVCHLHCLEGEVNRNFRYLQNCKGQVRFLK